jgi:membrane protease YdiL (CAAX protease family)
MTYDLQWKDADMEVMTALALMLGGFLCWYYLSHSPWLRQRLERRYGADWGQAYQVVVRRILGLVFYGILPAAVLLATQPYRGADYGLAFPFSAEAAYWAVGLSLVLAALASYAARKPESWVSYPEIRMAEWRRRTLILSMASWGGYMIGYEFAFRGYLLFAGVRAFGVWPAIAISTVIYSLVHVLKNRQEALGAIPLGILLCVITLRTGSIVVPVVVHSIMAFANNWFSLKYHPEMRLMRE